MTNDYHLYKIDECIKPYSVCNYTILLVLFSNTHLKGLLFIALSFLGFYQVKEEIA